MRKNIIIIILMMLPALAAFVVGYNFKKGIAPGEVRIDTVTVTDTTLQLKYDSALQVINTNSLPQLIKIIEVINHTDSTQSINQQINKSTNLYVYADSVRNKDLALYIVDTVTANKIIGRKLSYKILRPDSIITIETTNNITKEVARGTNNLFVGTQVGVNGSNMLLAPHVLYTTKKKLAFSLGYELYQHTPTIGIYYKIK